MGTWIEIAITANLGEITASFPSWERGLKSNEELLGGYAEVSFPSWERGLKLRTVTVPADPKTSFPSWERGLKLPESHSCSFLKSSFPSWERGLKSKIIEPDQNQDAVVPFVGTWIEICVGAISGAEVYCRSLRGNVD